MAFHTIGKIFFESKNSSAYPVPDLFSSKRIRLLIPGIGYAEIF